MLRVSLRTASTVVANAAIVGKLTVRVAIPAIPGPPPTSRPRMRIPRPQAVHARSARGMSKATENFEEPRAGRVELSVNDEPDHV